MGWRAGVRGFGNGGSFLRTHGSRGVASTIEGGVSFLPVSARVNARNTGVHERRNQEEGDHDADDDASRCHFS